MINGVIYKCHEGETGHIMGKDDQSRPCRRVLAGSETETGAVDSFLAGSQVALCQVGPLASGRPFGLSRGL